MDRFENTLKRVITMGNGLGGFFLMAIMVVVVLAVAGRLFRFSLAGANEVVEALIVVTVAFALPYTALKKGQVAIEIITERFSPRIRAYADVISQFLTFVIWFFILIAAITVTSELGLRELSHFIKLPILPFRIIWIIGLILISIVFLIDLIKAIKLAVTKKWIQ